jgi:hypothetical protein
MQQIIYTSQAAPEQSAGMVEAILAASRRNNARDGVTGILIHDGLRFIQALEGPELMVEGCFRRIAADPRHRALVTLCRRPVAERAFGDWAMAAEPIAPPADAPTLAETVAAMIANLRDPYLRIMLTSFATPLDAVSRSSRTRR